MILGILFAGIRVGVIFRRREAYRMKRINELTEEQVKPHGTESDTYILYMEEREADEYESCQPSVNDGDDRGRRGKKGKYLKDWE